MSRRDAVTGERWHIDRLPRIALYGFVAMTFSGWVATLAGWLTTEIGRQPWLVTGVLTTEAAVADVPAPMVLTTLIAYLAVYAALLVIYIGTLTYLCGKAARGGLPERKRADGAPPSKAKPTRPQRRRSKTRRSGLRAGPARGARRVIPPKPRAPRHKDYNREATS